MLTPAENSLRNVISSARRRWGQGQAAGWMWVVCGGRGLDPRGNELSSPQGHPCPRPPGHTGASSAPLPPRPRRRLRHRPQWVSCSSVGAGQGGGGGQGRGTQVETGRLPASPAPTHPPETGSPTTSPHPSTMARGRRGCPPPSPPRAEETHRTATCARSRPEKGRALRGTWAAGRPVCPHQTPTPGHPRPSFCFWSCHGACSPGGSAVAGRAT